MDTKPLISKCLAVGIILLFVGVTIAPIIHANDTLVENKSKVESEQKTHDLKFVYFNFNCNISGHGSYLILPFGTTFFHIFKYIIAYRNEKLITIYCRDFQDTIIGSFHFETTGGTFPDNSVSAAGTLKLVGFVGTMSFEEVDPIGNFIFTFTGHVVYVRSLGYYLEICEKG